MASRQEHERHLHALNQDKHKKRLTMLVAGLAVFFVVGGVVAGVMIKRGADEAAVLKAQTAQLQAQIDESQAKQARLASELENT